jgi:hypothetical protein
MRCSKSPAKLPALAPLLPEAACARALDEPIQAWIVAQKLPVGLAHNGNQLRFRKALAKLPQERRCQQHIPQRAEPDEHDAAHALKRLHPPAPRSIQIVTGPSLSSSTSIIAPKMPAAMALPSAWRHSARKCS